MTQLAAATPTATPVHRVGSDAPFIAGMSLLGRLKARVHGNRQAFVARPQDCHACGKCVAACPEDAIRLA